MLSRAYNALAIFSIATLLAGGGLVGYLGATGKLTQPRAQVVVETLRGEHDDLFAPEEEAEEAAPATDPNDPTNGEQPAVASARAAETLRERWQAQGLLSAALERELNDVIARQRLLDQATQELIEQGEAFETAQERWRKERERIAQRDLDEGFKRELEYVEGLQPDQAKEHLLRVWDKQPIDAVRIINGLPTSKGRRILDQFKSPQELEIMHELLERLRRLGLEESAPTAGTS